MKMSKANLQPSAILSSSTSERPASRAGTKKASANKSGGVLPVLCSSSSEEVSSQQGHMARLRPETETTADVPVRTVLTLHITRDCVKKTEQGMGKRWPGGHVTAAVSCRFEMAL